MTYVKLFGGPWDGRMENVHEDCNGLQLQSPLEPPRISEAYQVPTSTKTNFILHLYRRSPDDPARFVYEGTNR